MKRNEGGTAVAPRPKLMTLGAASRALKDVTPYKITNTAVPYLRGVCTGLGIDMTEAGNGVFLISVEDFARLAAVVRRAHAETGA